MIYASVLCKVFLALWVLIYLSLPQVISMPADTYRLYDKDIAKFSSDGELLQVEYARKAAMHGNSLLAAAIAGSKEVIVIAPSTKKLHILEENPIADKIMRIDQNSILAVSGLIGDGIYVAKMLRTFSLKFWTKLGTLPSALGLAKYLGGLQHGVNLKGGKRPFGIQALLIGSKVGSPNELEMFEIDVSGAIEKKVVSAIGQHCESYLDKLCHALPAGLEDLGRDEVASLFIKVCKQFQKDDELKNEVAYDLVSFRRNGDVTEIKRESIG